MRTALLLGSALAAGFAVGRAQPDDGAPPAPAAARAPEDWLADRSPPPTAFPDIAPIGAVKFAGHLDYVAACPTLYRNDSVRVADGDDTHRRILKARLNQGRFFLRRAVTRLEHGNAGPADVETVLAACDDIRVTAGELWRADAPTLGAWLADLVRFLKTLEGFAQQRVAAGTDPPQSAYVVSRRRLAAESDLWKVRNPAPGP